MRCSSRPMLLVALILCGGCECSGPTPGASTAVPSEGPPANGRVRVRVSAEPKVPRACRVKCRIMGQCTYDAEKKECVAKNDEECRRSRGCRVNGLCTAQGGACVGSNDEDCRASERCANEGLCHFRGVGATNCMAKSVEDCKASKYCPEKGACTFFEDRCVTEIPEPAPSTEEPPPP